MSAEHEPPVLSCDKLDIEIAGRTLLRGLSQRFEPGRICAILGRNGVGKTTTLHTLAGIHKPGSGTIKLAGKPLGMWQRTELARRLGLLIQGQEIAFPSTVLAAALIGRHPHIGLWAWEGPDDYAIARAALASLDMAALEDRDVSTLSGGEKQRLAIATVLAQETSVVMLDEPVSNLDPRFQIMVMTRLRELAHKGRSVILSLHDVNLARAWCDHALLLFGDGGWQSGSCAQVINSANLSRLYETRFLQTQAGGLPLFYPLGEDHAQARPGIE